MALIALCQTLYKTISKLFLASVSSLPDQLRSKAVDRTPGAQHDLVAGTDRVIARDGDVVDRAQGVRGGGEETRAEERQLPPRGGFDELLELAGFGRRLGAPCRHFGADQLRVARARAIARIVVALLQAQSLLIDALAIRVRDPGIPLARPQFAAV